MISAETDPVSCDSWGEVPSHFFRERNHESGLPMLQPGALSRGGLTQLPAFYAALCVGDRTKGSIAAL